MKIKNFIAFAGLSMIVFVCSCTGRSHKKTFIISGTYLEVISPDKDAAGIVYDEFKRLNNIFNLYDSNSEISRLNQTYNTPFKVSKELFEILELSLQLEDLTEGAFNVSYGLLYDFWKGLIKSDKPISFPSQAKIDELKEYGGSEYIELRLEERAVLIKKKGLKIDFSAIAKGYMVDKSVFRLQEKGIKNVLINAGGDLYCLGRNRGQSWTVGIKDPKALGGLIESQDLSDEAIATSGDYEQFFVYEGRQYSHLIDPRTGYPINNNILSVSVIAKNCTTADSLATSFSIMGIKKLKEFLSKNPSNMRIFAIVSEEGGKRIHVF